MLEPHADEEADLTPPSAFLSVPPGPGGDRGPGPPRLASGSQPPVLLVGGTAAPPLQLGTPEPGAQSALLFALLSAKSSIPTRLGGRGARTARPTPQTWPWRPADQGVVGRAPGCLRLRSAASPAPLRHAGPCALRPRRDIVRAHGPRLLGAKESVRIQTEGRALGRPLARRPALSRALTVTMVTRVAGRAKACGQGVSRKVGGATRGASGLSTVPRGCCQCPGEPLAARRCSSRIQV